MLFPRGTHCLSCRKRGFYIGRLFSVLAFASLAAPSLARPRHHVEYVPSLPISSGNAVVSNAMGVMEGAGGIEDETSRLQSTFDEGGGICRKEEEERDSGLGLGSGGIHAHE